MSKNPGTVVLMLDSPEETVLQSACEALYTFAEKCKWNYDAFSTGSVSGRCRSEVLKISHGVSCSTISDIVGEENRQTLLNLGALERLLKHIRSEDTIIRRNATMCLGTMCQNGKFIELSKWLTLLPRLIILFSSS